MVDSATHMAQRQRNDINKPIRAGGANVDIRIQYLRLSKYLVMDFWSERCYQSQRRRPDVNIAAMCWFVTTCYLPRSLRKYSSTCSSTQKALVNAKEARFSARTMNPPDCLV